LKDILGKKLAVVVIVFMLLLPDCIAAEPDAVRAAKAKQWEPISTGAFADSINHVIMRYKARKPPYDQFKPEQIVHIAENLLAWQNEDGGWPKNKDWLKIMSPEELAALPKEKKENRHNFSTLDNGSTWSQIDYLARVYQRTGLKQYADSALRGIDFILAAQRDSGGWRGADVDAITFNDDVMVGALRTLQSVVADKALYDFVDDEMRAQAEAAFNKGIDCILKCQIRKGDRLTAWCQQHDHRTFQPAWARSFEPPSIVTSESVGVVSLLMSLDDPTPEIVESVRSAVGWFKKVGIKGLRLERKTIKPVKFPYHWANFDLVEVKDPTAPIIWTRYYDLKTEEPIFCTRKGEITKNFTDLSLERRTGYAWYGYWPNRILESSYPEWERKWGGKEKNPS